MTEPPNLEAQRQAEALAVTATRDVPTAAATVVAPHGLVATTGPTGGA